jgi:DNA-binding transcriptional MerR regulator
MRSGELARRAGVSTDTLRHYEALGLLQTPGRTSGNYREYSPEAAERVHLIRNALAMGFSLKELAAILKIRDAGGIPCCEVRRMAAEKVAAITTQIEELTCYRDHLQRVLSEWDLRLRQTGKHQRAHLLQALASCPVRPVSQSQIGARLRVRP